MRVKRLAVTACAVLVAAVAAIAIAVSLLVPRLLAPSLAASVKAASGRELSFGDVGVTLWPRPSLVLSQVRLGNTSWGSQPWLAQVGRATAELDAWGLLSGRLRIRQVAVTDATVLLETDAAGTGNWVMGSQDAARPAWPEALSIDALTLQAVAFNYRDGKTGKVTSVQLDAARFAAASASSPIELNARAAFDGKLVHLDGSIGPLATLLANGPLLVNLEGKFGAASVSVRGSVDTPLGLAGVSLALRAEAPDLAELSALVGATGGLTMWWLMKLWPSWFWFVLMMALFTLLFATRIFADGPGPLKPNYYRWSYGLSTLVFIVFPDALTQGFTGDAPDMKFYQRILDYLLITTYSVCSIVTYDAIVQRLRAWRRRTAARTGPATTPNERLERTDAVHGIRRCAGS